MKLKITYKQKTGKELFFAIIFVILLFQMALQSSSNSFISTVFNYADEAIALVFLCFIIAGLLQGYKFKFYDKMILIFSIIFLLLGLISSAFSELQAFVTCASDMFVCSKFAIGYFGARIFFENINKDFIRNSVNNICCIISTIFFIIVVHDSLFSPWFRRFDYRYWGRSMMICYPHPTYLAAASSILLLVLAMCNKKRENIPFMLMISYVIISTFRSKAMAFVAIFWGLYILIAKLKIKSKLLYAGLSIPIVVYLSYDQMQEYYFTTKWSARSVMLTDAISIAKQYFPLGAGYATFGSNMSVREYSPLYYQLGYYKIQGMSEDTASYLNDGFWQIVFGQFGFIGAILFAIIIIYFFRNAFRFKPEAAGYVPYVTIISANIYMLISSVAETAYFAPFGLLFFMIIGMITNQGQQAVLDLEREKRIRRRSRTKIKIKTSSNKKVENAITKNTSINS
jgi:hypothetical protein